MLGSAPAARVSQPHKGCSQGLTAISNSLQHATAAHFSVSAVTGHAVDQQLPGTAMPVMQQLQRNQQQLQQQLQAARLQLQHKHQSAQQSQYQQQQQHPVLLPKPGLKTIQLNPSGFVGDSASMRNPDMPLDPRAIQQLRVWIATATEMQQLLQLMPAVAADRNPDSVTRVLLQAVRIQNSTNSSEAEADGSNFTTAAEGLQAAGRQQQELQELLQQCDAALLQCYRRMMFQHVSGVLWSWSQLQWMPSSSKLHASTAQGAAIGEDGVREQLLVGVVDRLKRCTVQQELSGKVPGFGSQLARATTACAKLNIHDRKAWAKLHSMITALAHTLNPSEVACCCWGLARGGQTAKNQGASSAYTALLTKAHQIAVHSNTQSLGFKQQHSEQPGFSQAPGSSQQLEFSHNAQLASHNSVYVSQIESDFTQDGQLGFTRVGALNVIWAICSADLVSEAPSGLLQRLVQIALGQQYTQWQQRQQQYTQQQQQYTQQQQHKQQEETAVAQASALKVGGFASSSKLLPQELTCLVWSLATAARHSYKRLRASQQIRHWPQQQSSTSSRDSSSSGQQLLAANRSVYHAQYEPHEDLELVKYLAEVVTEQLSNAEGRQFEPRQVATLAYGFALLLQHQLQSQVYKHCASQNQEKQQRNGLHWGWHLQQQLQQQLIELIRCLWSKALSCKQCGQQQLQQWDERQLHQDQHQVEQLAEFKLKEVHMLLESVVLLQKLQGQQQQQQQQMQIVDYAGESGMQPMLHQQGEKQHKLAHLGVAHSQQVALTDVATAITAAAVSRVVAVEPAELQPQTAAALLYVFTKLQYFRAGPAAAAGPMSEPSSTHSSNTRNGLSAVTCCKAAVTPTALAERLLHTLSSNSSLGCFRDQELAMLAAAAGQLAAADNGDSHSSSSSSSSSSSERQSSSSKNAALQAAATTLLSQLTLPLAAAAFNLKLRELSTAVCAYATASHSAPQLFDAVSRAVQHRGVLDNGSTWGLARLLSAYATVGHTDERLFAAVVDAMLPKLGLVQPRALARLAWALAESGYHDLQVFTAIGAQISSTGSVEHFQPRDISALAWALGTVGYRDPQPYRVLAEAGLQALQRFSVSQLANLLWGLAAAGVYHEGLVTQVTALLADTEPRQQPLRQATSVLARTNHQLDQGQHQLDTPYARSPAAAAAPADVATLAWSLAELRCLTPAVLQVCGGHFLGSTERYSASDAADLAWAVVSSGWAVQQVAAAAAQNSSPISSSSRAGSASSSNSRCAGAAEANGGPRRSRDRLASVGANGHLDVLQLLQQLLVVVMNDLEQLTPQQLANTVLIAAVIESSAVSGISTASTSQQQLRQWRIEILTSVAGWGSGAFTAADGAKLLWAQLLLGQPLVEQQQLGEQQELQQQHGPQQQRTLVLQKLLSAGVRAVLHSTAQTCSSSFGQDFLAVLNSINGIKAQPVVSAAGAAKAATQAAQAVVKTIAPAGAAPGLEAGAGCAAAGIPGTDGARELAAATPGAGARHRASNYSLWDALGDQVTAQLLGHVLVQIKQDAARVANSSSSAAAEDSSRVLVYLAPSSQLARTKDPSFAIADQQLGSLATDTIATATGGLVCGQHVTGVASVVTGLLLQQQTCYSRAVVVTEAVWQQWEAAGGWEAQAEALKQLLQDAASD